MIKVFFLNGSGPKHLTDPNFQLPTVPRPGDFIEWGKYVTFRVESVHYQPGYDGVGITTTQILPSDYGKRYYGDQGV